MKNINKILCFKEVSKLVKLSRTTIWRLQKTGSFPMARKISEHRIGFLSKEIDKWIEKREKKVGINFLEPKSIINDLSL